MRAAVVIGVDRVDGDLPQLNAAAKGAAEVAEWLRRSGYEVSLFTDRHVPVTRSDIFAAVNKLVQKGTVQKLIIYFAGHGFLKGPLDEYWLLSGAPVDPSEAVNVTYSAAAARYRGIPQIIFISDACRVVPQSNVHAGITGGSIVPNLEPSRRSSEIDFFYATRPGDPAYERTSKEALDAHGLFTKELLDAHKAAPPKALISVGNRVYVRNDWLKEVLEDRVSLRAETIALRLTQLPDIQIQIRSGYIALNESDDNGGGDDLFQSNKTEGENWATKSRQPYGAPKKRGMSRTAAKRPSIDLKPAPTLRSIINKTTWTGSLFEDRLKFLQQAEQAVLDSTRSSTDEPRLTCIGDNIEAVSLGAGLERIIRAPKLDSTLRFHLSGAASQVAVKFSDDTGMLLPVLREYACEIVRHKGRTLSVNYSWLPYPEPALAGLRAAVLSAATLGLLSPSREAAGELAQELRRAKRYDPTLGLVAALAYTLAGDAEGASSVRDYMEQDLHIDLFDSWLLGGGGAERPPIYPSVPLLAQSWTFLDVFDVVFPEELKQLRRVAGFWTVFEASSMARIMRLASESPQEWMRHG